MSEATVKSMDWGGALLLALVVNLVLFLVMPALIAVHSGGAECKEFDLSVTLTKVRQEQKKEKKEKPPEPPKKKPTPPKPPQNLAMQRPKLSLPFELNQRLPAAPGGLVLPPIDASLPQGGLSGIFSVGDLDGQLMPLAQFPPTYPYGAKRRQIEGWVQLQFIVNERGVVEDIRVIAAEPEGVFESAARQSISRWRFKPGTIGGSPVKTKVEQTIKFTLD